MFFHKDIAIKNLKTHHNNAKAFESKGKSYRLLEIGGVAFLVTIFLLGTLFNASFTLLFRRLSINGLSTGRTKV